MKRKVVSVANLSFPNIYLNTAYFWKDHSFESLEKKHIFHQASSYRAIDDLSFSAQKDKLNRPLLCYLQTIILTYGKIKMTRSRVKIANYLIGSKYVSWSEIRIFI